MAIPGLWPGLSPDALLPVIWLVPASAVEQLHTEFVLMRLEMLVPRHNDFDESGDC